MYYHDLNKIRIIMLVYLKAIIKQGVGLPKTRRIFFTRKNYPQSIDTDHLFKKIDRTNFNLI